MKDYTPMIFAASAVVIGGLILARACPSRAMSSSSNSSTQRTLASASASQSCAATAYEANGMPILPKDVTQYSKIPAKKPFTATTIPKGLLKQHNTKAGTWGVIRVAKGQLEYTIHEPAPTSVHIVDADRPGIIEPTKYHQVKALTDDLEFNVEFYRLPGTGPVKEKREGFKDE